MARLSCLVFLPAILTAVFGYPSTVPSVQGHLIPGELTEESAQPGGAKSLHEEPDVIAAASADAAKTTLSVAALEPTENQDPVELESEVIRRKRKPDEFENNDDEDDDSDMFMEPQETDEEVVKVEEETEERAKEALSRVPFRDNHGMGQHFFPSFAPVFSLGHSRPPQLFHQENYYSKSRAPPPPLGPDFNPFRAYRDSSYKVPVAIDDEPISTNILGSGNFGVLKGGTYYNDEDRGELGLFSPYYNNGHGRPYSANPRPQKYSNGDFFANFRDFADINTPNKASFSEYVIVYVNKNASKTDEGVQVLPPSKGGRPKNIIEQLSMLDSYPGSDEVETSAPEKKGSLHKRKLALLHQEKTNKEKKSYFKKKEPLEPLLALS